MKDYETMSCICIFERLIAWRRMERVSASDDGVGQSMQKLYLQRLAILTCRCSFVSVEASSIAGRVTARSYTADDLTLPSKSSDMALLEICKATCAHYA